MARKWAVFFLAAQSFLKADAHHLAFNPTIILAEAS